MKKKPNLLPDEEIILTDNGFYKDNLRSGWKAGELYLTNQRLFFWQAAQILVQIPLESIRGINVQKRGFVLRNKDALCLSYLPPRSKSVSDRRKAGPSVVRAWFMVKNEEDWKNRIFERSLFRVNEENIDEIAGELDPESRSVLLFIWENQHATIGELAILYPSPNHMEVLHRIRDVINPTAEKVTGFPVLVFEKSRIEESTGQKILFSWWIIGGLKPAEEESILDVFDEGDYLNVIMELKGARKEDIMVNMSDDGLVISCRTSRDRYYEEISLPLEVDREGIVKKYHNNILEVRLPKREQTGVTQRETT
ncbi:MAG: hypothetical protein P9M10_07365 [Candidatus Euphemobacter frigidus]|nr:hypothetical protein [Candidatus Euphemobacter frigidus]